MTGVLEIYSSYSFPAATRDWKIFLSMRWLLWAALRSCRSSISQEPRYAVQPRPRHPLRAWDDPPVWIYMESNSIRFFEDEMLRARIVRQVTGGGAGQHRPGATPFA